MEPIFLKPVLQEKIWGGQQLAPLYEGVHDDRRIGEAWCISAHPNGPSVVCAPERFAGLTLTALYEQQPQLFGEPQSGPFPLLIKLLDAAEDLSVQVHPDDAYALAHEGELGKTECWYVVAAEPGARIIYGHTAPTKEAFAEQVAQEAWDELLCAIPVKAGDFFAVPHGTLHAIGAGIMILETQQNSDTTYRVYDYGRRDDQGNLRPLHLQQALEVTQIPHRQPASQECDTVQSGGTVRHCVTNDFFSVSVWIVSEVMTVPLVGPYELGTVIAGSGCLRVNNTDYSLQAGDAFIIPHGVTEVQVTGALEIVASHPVQS